MTEISEHPNLGLNAWQVRRRNRVRRLFSRTVLLTGLVGAALYATPPHINPLVHAGILHVPRPASREVSIPSIALAIPVTERQLPRLRPSLSAARQTDKIEAAHIVGVIPVIAENIPITTSMEDEQDLSVSGTGTPMLSVIELDQHSSTEAPRTPLTGTLQQQKSSPAQAAKPTSPFGLGADENFDDVKKRVFNSDR